MRIIRFDNKGWRTRFDRGFDEQNVARAADAFAYIWAETNPGGTVLVGYDTRFRGKDFAEVVGGVLASYGLRAMVSDAPCPTPALGWSVARDEQAVGAVVITASSASCEYGGISARGADGGPMSSEFYEVATKIVSSVPIRDRGEVEYVDLMGPYLAHVMGSVDASAIADWAPSIVVDPMYGAAQGYVCDLLSQMGCRVSQIHGEPDTNFGGLHPSPVEPWVDKCEQAVLQTGGAFGIAFDGDADRLGIVDERGVFVEPYRVAPLVLDHLVSERQQHGRVVSPYACSAYIRRQAARLGCPLTAVPMGFTRIYHEILEGDVVLGTEELGGISVPSHLNERDGIFAALLLVEACAQRQVGIAELVQDMESSIGSMHHVNKNIRLDPASIQSFRNILPGLNLRDVCGKEPIYVGHADGLVLRFDDDSWVQLRPSRTESLVRAHAEAPNTRQVENMVEAACKSALQRLPLW